MSSVKKICFFGAVGACDPMRIGGSESFVRRLAIGLSEKNYSVAIVMYGAEKNEIKNSFLAANVSLQYYKAFLDALKGVDDLESEIVFEIYIHKRYYPFYLWYKYRNKAKKFAIVFMTSAENVIKKWLRRHFRVMFCSDVFAVSPHIAAELKRDGINAKWLPPPVPDIYFQTVRDRQNSGIVVSYLGRIDENKGVRELQTIFEQLPDTDNITIKIRGYYILSDRESIKLHKAFMRFKGIDYLATPKNDGFYSLEKEKEILEFLSDTDILLLPYKNLQGTVELPLLVLEGLAAGCVVLTMDIGDIRSVIDDAECIASSFKEFKEKLQRLCDTETLGIVRKRLKSKDFFSAFAMSKVINRLIDYL